MFEHIRPELLLSHFAPQNISTLVFSNIYLLFFARLLSLHHDAGMDKIWQDEWLHNAWRQLILMQTCHCSQYMTNSEANSSEVVYKAVSDCSFGRKVPNFGRWLLLILILTFSMCVCKCTVHYAICARLTLHMWLYGVSQNVLWSYNDICALYRWHTSL